MVETTARGRSGPTPVSTIRGSSPPSLSASAYRTLKGMEAMRSLRKGQGTMLDLTLLATEAKPRVERLLAKK